MATKYKKKAKYNKNMYNKLVKIERNLPKPEFKVLDESVTYYLPSSAGQCLLLNGMIRGDERNMREADQVNIRSFEIRYTWEAQALIQAGTFENTACRIILFKDKQANGLAPSVAQVLRYNDVLSARNLDNRKRFKIIWDKFHTLSSAGQTITMGKKYKKLNIPVQYNSGQNTGTVTDILTNSLYLLIISSEPGPLGNYPTLRFTTRLRYTD